MECGIPALFGYFVLKGYIVGKSRTAFWKLMSWLSFKGLPIIVKWILMGSSIGLFVLKTLIIFPKCPVAAELLQKVP